ncbi:MAG: hypothetical protein PUB86_04010 [Elusimicrobia bacterium]|nr:hypothetical protein [Elusimicrobiota bacterium]
MKQIHKRILKEIGLKARESDLKAWAVGGFARDTLIGKNTEDIDICVEGDTSPLIKFCAEKYGADVVRFNDFATARVNLSCGLKLDFVRCRAEVYDKPGALPKVRPAGLKEDLFRRDFTANALALSIMPDEFFKEYDFFNSEEAVLKGYIKVLHDKSFLDDPTRLFRAVRFAARFNWSIETSTERLMREAVEKGYVNFISRQRAAHEFIKILAESRPYQALKCAAEYKLVDFVFTGLKLNPKINNLKTIEEKLAYLSLLQGERGFEFLDSLLLPKKDTALALETLKWRKSKAAPSKPLSKNALRIIRLYKPDIEGFKLKPLLLSAADLNELGYEGPALGAKLKALAKAQYAGKIKTRRAAFLYVKKTGF